MGDRTVGANPGERVLVFTATYNEHDNIPLFCEAVLALDPSYDLLVVDDNSPDGTGELLDDMKAREPRLAVVHRPRKMGLGSAHKLAMVHAVKNGYPVLVTMDADFSHDPADIPRLVGELGNADFVIASRHMPGATLDYPFHRKFVSAVANLLARRLLAIPLHEFTTSFRAFRSEVLTGLNFPKIRAQGYSFFLESIYRVHQHGFACREIPIDFRDRLHGSSKIPRFEIVRGVSKLLRLFVSRLLRHRRPRRPSPVIEGTCYACESPYLIEQFSERATPAGLLRDRAARPRIVHCLACGLGHAREVPGVGGVRSADLRGADETDGRIRRARRRTYLRAYNGIAHHLPPGGRLLEVGSGYGAFLEVARERGWDVEGVESAAPAQRYSRDQLGVPVRAGPLDEAVARLGNGYDVVVLWDVLDHLQDPLAMLGSCAARLRDGGVLCLSALDAESWFPRLMGPNWPRILQGREYYFSPPVLELMLHRAGFDLVEVRNFRRYVPLKLLPDRVAAAVPGGYGKALRLLEPLLPSGISAPISLGDSKIFVCRKQAAPAESAAADAGTAAIHRAAGR